MRIDGLAEYLGVGYDVLFGNPMGDPVQMNDPGYKLPIVKFAWTLGPEGLTGDLSHLQPLGVNIRRYRSCHQSSTVRRKTENRI